MQTSFETQKSRPIDLLWYLLAEYSLSEFMSDKETGNVLMAGSLLQTIRDLGIPPECLNRIERTLIDFVKQTTVRLQQGKRGLPIVIRLFYGKKVITSGNKAQTASDPQAKQTIEPTQMIHPADTNIFSGWGFFIIERTRDITAGSAVDSPKFIDLFLYKEGE